VRSKIEDHVEGPAIEGNEDHPVEAPQTGRFHGGSDALPVKALLATVIGVVVVAAACWMLLAGQTYQPPSGTQVAAPLGTATVNGQTLPHVALNFSTYPFSNGTNDGAPVHPGGNRTWPATGPTPNFQVPANALVTVTVRQYDGGAALNDPWFANVRGTIGNVATIDGRVVHAINPNRVGHSFLLQSLPGAASGFLVNVPFPAVNGDWGDSGKHRTIVFDFVSGPKGTYVWNCEFPCGQMIGLFGSAMSTFGYMSGYLHAV
jgi:hypothetical protein